MEIIRILIWFYVAFFHSISYNRSKIGEMNFKAGERERRRGVKRKGDRKRLKERREREREKITQFERPAS